MSSDVLARYRAIKPTSVSIPITVAYAAIQVGFSTYRFTILYMGLLLVAVA